MSISRGRVCESLPPRKVMETNGWASTELSSSWQIHAVSLFKRDNDGKRYIAHLLEKTNAFTKFSRSSIRPEMIPLPSPLPCKVDDAHPHDFRERKWKSIGHRHASACSLAHFPFLLYFFLLFPTSFPLLSPFGPSVFPRPGRCITRPG